MNIIKSKLLVGEMLKLHGATRDNDNKLIAYCWYYEAKKKGMLTDEVKEFLTIFSRGEFTTPESITRCRRVLQESNPELRGRKYAERHGRTESVKAQVKEIKAERKEIKQQSIDKNGQSTMF